MQRFSHRLCLLAIVVFALGVSATLARATEAGRESRGYQEAIMQPPRGGGFGLDQSSYRATNAVLKEFGPARNDHNSIALHIGRCYESRYQRGHCKSSH